MINRILNLLTNTKFVIALIALSLLIVIFGIVMVVSTSPENTESPEVVQNGEPTVDTSFADSLQQTEELIDANAQSVLASSADVVQLERGGEAWCEAMLVKAGSEWNEADTQLFAQKCI